jgi:hypothetical protein
LGFGKEFFRSFWHRTLFICLANGLRVVFKGFEEIIEVPVLTRGLSGLYVFRAAEESLICSYQLLQFVVFTFFGCFLDGDGGGSLV